MICRVFSCKLPSFSQSYAHSHVLPLTPSSLWNPTSLLIPGILLQGLISFPFLERLFKYYYSCSQLRHNPPPSFFLGTSQTKRESTKAPPSLHLFFFVSSTFSSFFISCSMHRQHGRYDVIRLLLLYHLLLSCVCSSEYRVSISGSYVIVLISGNIGEANGSHSTNVSEPWQLQQGTKPPPTAAFL